MIQDISLNNIIINIKNYKIKQYIPNDGLGDVFEGKDKITKRKVAIKFFKKNTKNISNCLSELNTLRLLNLPGTVKILGFRFPLHDEEISDKKQLKLDNADPTGAVLITEFMNNGSLCSLIPEYLEKQGQSSYKINPTIRSKIIFGVAATMNHLHKYNIAHRNLKLKKVLLNDDMEPRISYSILSKVLLNDEPFEKEIYSPLNTPPEMLIDDVKYDLSVDVYAFSFFLYLMFSNEIKFPDSQGKTQNDFLKSILSGNRPERPTGIPQVYWDLIELCWKQNPEERPTFSEIIKELEDDKYAIEEFGMKTDLDQLKEYRFKIKQELNEDEQNDYGKNDDPKIKKLLQQFIKRNQFLNTQDERQMIIHPSRRKCQTFDLQAFEKLKKIKLIGHGSISNVFKVSRKESYALKIYSHDIFQTIESPPTNEETINKDDYDSENENESTEEETEAEDDPSSFLDLENLKSFQKDLELLDSLNHPNIARSFGFFYGDKDHDPAALFELCPSTLKKSVKILSDVERVSIIYEICETMSCVHQTGVVHRNLKPENVLLDEDNHVKLCDFGVTKLINSESYQFISPYHFMAPELFQNPTIYDQKVDVYSFGILVYYILTKGECPKIAVADIVLGKRPDIPQCINQFSRKLINDCCENLPQNRPDFAQLVIDIRENQFGLINGVEKKLSEIIERLGIEENIEFS